MKTHPFAGFASDPADYILLDHLTERGYQICIQALADFWTPEAA